ncbi:hypothetical protein MY3296_009667 [Beauveria thailandica]
MIIHVLNYTQLWPFLTGDLMAAAAISNLDREIFYGPSGRYTDHTSWSPLIPPPVDKRGPTITSLYVRACDDIDGVGIKHNRTWDDIQGSDTGGSPTQLDLSPVKSVTRPTPSARADYTSVFEDGTFVDIEVAQCAYYSHHRNSSRWTSCNFQQLTSFKNAVSLRLWSLYGVLQKECKLGPTGSKATLFLLL